MDFHKGRLSLADEVCNQIMHKIKSGEWELGTKLPSETSLCKMFGVSRTSIRAALQNLQGSNIIVTMQGVGSFVHSNLSSKIDNNSKEFFDTDITSKDFDDFFQFRCAVEFVAIDIIGAKKKDVSDLRVIAENMLKAAKSQSFEKYIKYDFDFHIKLIELSDNHYLVEAMDKYKSVFFHYIEEISRLTHKPFVTIAEEHVWMCDLIEGDKANEAKQYLYNSNSYSRLAYFNKEK